ncbi:MAG: D-aminoacylase [Planctomycetes bacterium]|nr:D-aminoacylase [Planctomycetota bacterium]
MHSFLLTALLACSGAAQDNPVQADVVIENATIIDGTGQPGKVGDVAIKDDKIVAVGKFQVAGKPKRLDATGLILAPGFIDLHTHSDFPLQKKETSANRNYLMQGVTTAVTGNCGAGPADCAAYFRTLEKLGIGTNVIHQVPHNAVREKVMGNANRDATPEELKAMENLVEQGMKDGAYGMATGLIYTPGTYCKTDELITLAKVVARHDGLYASHIRDEGADVMRAIEEILTIARKAGIRVHISHIKVSGRRSWGKGPDVIALVRRARKEGVPVTADQYPYHASSTSLAATVIPARFREGSAKDMIARLDDAEMGPKMTKAIADRLSSEESAKAIKVASFAAKKEWQGKDLFAIAELEKRTPLDIALEITRKGGAGVVNFSMDEAEVRLFMKEPYVATASDGSSMVPSDTVPHPRSYGTFPRKIGRYAIEDKVISLEQAIRSSTGLPADILKLPQRGYIKPGYYADVVVFDPKTFRDQATFEKPHQYATGVVYLFVNGRLAVEKERYTGELAGKVLRHRN